MKSTSSPQIAYKPQPIIKLSLTICMLLTKVIALPLTSSSSDFTTSRHHSGDGDELPRTTGRLILDLLNIAGLVLLGGVFAGLTLALMGLDQVNLQVLSTSGTDDEKIRAAKVLKLLEKGRHWVLVVLLLGNVIVNETLPIFLSDFGGGFAAVLSSTVLIVIFGEIVPQSICARYGLAIGAWCAPFVKVMMYLMAPIAWPTAKLLDWCLGHDEGTTYRKAELKTLVSLHSQIGTENLNDDEVTIIRAVLDLNDKTIRTVMTPIEDVFTLPADHVLDEENVSKLVQSGYSRVPIHEPGKPDAILGMLLVKKLIAYDPEDAMPVSWFQLTPLPEASPDLTLLDCLNYFQQGRSHMLLVSTHPGEPEGALGVVTLEDVVEELIGEEIIDETDVFVDVHNKIRVRRNKRDGDKSNALGPLIHGIIERRRKIGGPGRAPLRSSYGTIGPASRSNSISNSPAVLSTSNTGTGIGGSQPRAIDKVAIKRPGSPLSSSNSLSNHNLIDDSTSPKSNSNHKLRSDSIDSSSNLNQEEHQPFIVEVGSQGKSRVVQSRDIPSQILENKAGEEQATNEESSKDQDAEAGERQPLLQKLNPFSK